tara:strand:- start:101 stop:676 length:576 start_codon:yes stop_codon:yes gene_type:complete
MDKLKKNKPLTTESKKNTSKKINNKKNQNNKIDFVNLQNQLKNSKEENLRHLAEIDNLRKRFDKEREDTFKYAVTEFANEIILVADNFTRVIESISLIKKENNDSVKPLVEGVDLIYKDFLRTLEKFEIKKIDCLGKKFDPNYHQAISEEEKKDKETGEIIKVIQDGYLIKDRLLRPASVIVAKKGENKEK